MPEEQHSTKSMAEGDRDTYEKWKPTIETEADLRKALAISHDYRGDVTFTTKAGETVVGYVFNSAPDVADPYIEYFPKGVDEKKRLYYRDVAELYFSGIDPAAGRSWDTWIKKNEEKKKALAEGREVGNIEPENMPLED